MSESKGDGDDDVLAAIEEFSAASSEQVGAAFHASQPGAFATAPGQNSSRQLAVEFSLFHNDTGSSTLGTGSSDAPAAFSSSIPTSQGNQQQLLEARPVDEDEEKALPGAIPVDPDHNDKSEELTRTETQTKVGFLGLLALLLVVILVAVVLTSSISNSSSETPTIPSTSAPIYSSAPTVSPTPAPTAEPLILEGLVSNKSIKAINIPLTPQNKAYEWLISHPEIGNMTDWRKTQLFALSTFFYSFHGNDWVDVVRDDWLVPEESECLWYSSIFAKVAYSMFENKYALFPVTTNETSCSDDGRFTRLSVKLKGRMATMDPANMPPEIALLSDLEEISMNFIAINGPVSGFFIPELNQLTSLRSIDLTANNLTGTIPSSLFHELPTHIENLVIKGGALSGTLPTQIGLLSNLNELHLSNGLNGTIPRELGRLTFLERLGLTHMSSQETSFIGSLPTDLYDLTRLSAIDLSNTDLTGTLASQLGQWTRMKYMKITAHFSGTIPSSISDLRLLETIVLNNNFSGSLPILTNSDYLHQLDLSNNKFTGSIPENMFANQEWQKSLGLLRLDDNLLTGSLPDDFWNLTSLRIVNLGNNLNLAGTLPASKLRSFSHLSYFNLSYSSFYGTIPFAAFSNSSGWMNSLQLNGNRFSGSLDSQVGLLTRLNDLDLAYNQNLNGSIPEELGNCTWMKSLQLQGNVFYGSIPSQLGKLRFLNLLNLANNTEIGGQIPSELGLLTMLKSLVLDGTSLSGSVPDEVCSLRNLTIGSLAELRVNCDSVICNCNCTCVE